MLAEANWGKGERGGMLRYGVGIESDERWEDETLVLVAEERAHTPGTSSMSLARNHTEATFWVLAWHD